MEYNNIFRSNQFMCHEHRARYSTVTFSKDASKKFLCAKCLEGHIYSNLMDIEDVLSLEAIAEYENKYIKHNKESANDAQKIGKDVLAKIDIVFEKYTEQLQKMKSLCKERILSISQEIIPEILSQELFDLTESLRADLKSFYEDPNLLRGQKIEN